jgi:HEXXH motif-containing protein
MLLWCGRVVTRDAPEAYSALKNTKRPMERILLGFHAFANILLMFPQLRQATDRIDPKELAGHVQHVSSIVRELDSVLQEHWERYLEPQGRELYLPLRERLVAAELLSQR